MKIFNLFKGEEETKEVNSSLPVYRVTWKRLTDGGSSNYFKNEVAVRFFTNKEEAEEFAYQLRQAHKLLESNESYELVILTKEKEGGL